MSVIEDEAAGRTLNAFRAAWARKDVVGLMGLVTDDCVYSASVGPEPGMTWHGRDAVRDGFVRLLAYDHGESIGGDWLIAEGRGYAEWRYSVTGPDGSQRTVRGCDILIFRDGKISRKDAFRKMEAAAPPAVAAASLAPPVEALAPLPYRARRFASLGLWVLRGFRLKVYGISHRPQAVGELFHSAALIDAARHHTHDRLADAIAEGNHHDLGFVILHEGLQGLWLLVDWWAHGDICCQLLSHADDSRPLRFAPVRPSLVACAWELVPIGFERTAWVETMLTERPDPEAYLARRLPDGNYRRRRLPPVAPQLAGPDPAPCLRCSASRPPRRNRPNMRRSLKRDQSGWLRVAGRLCSKAK